MKNILFVADSFLGGGLETRIIDQVSYLKTRHAKSFLICREYNPIYNNTFSEVSDALMIKASHSEISSSVVLKDAETICRFCKKNHITNIDCHPFWCALPAVLAAEKLKIPITFTLHGVISGDFIDNKYITAKTLYQTIFSYGFDQLFAVAEYLSDLYPHLPDKTILRNGFPTDNIKHTPFTPNGAVAIASRLDEAKTPLITNFLPTLYNQKDIKIIDIYGDGDSAKALTDFVSTHQMSDKVHLCGWTKDLTSKTSKKQYMAIFGMGRVIVEAIEAGIPAGVLGYGGFAGFVNHNNLIDFSKTNLTSWSESRLSLDEEIEQLLASPSYYIFEKQNISELDSKNIWKQYHEVISSLVHTDKLPITLIYQYLNSHHSANILFDENLLLECVRILSDGSIPISPQLFYAIFQKQFDEIGTLTAENHHLKNEINSSLPKKLYHKLISKKS